MSGRLAFAIITVAAACLGMAAAALSCSSSGEELAPDARVVSSRDARAEARAKRDAAVHVVVRRPDGGDAGGNRDGGVDAAPPPLLTELGVSVVGDGAPDNGLVPPFAPDIHDYYVRCGAGLNAVTVSMKASPGAESLVLDPVPSASLPAQTVTFGALENEAVVVAVTDSIATTEYWVRCLPHDFPKMQMVLHREAGTPASSYYLVGNQQLEGNAAGYAMVLDGNGVPVWYQRTKAKASVVDVDNVVDGAVSFIPFPNPSPFEVHPLAPAASYTIGTTDDPHELQALPNGDFLSFDSPEVSGVDLTGLALPLPDGGALALGPSSTIVTCNIREIDPSGNVVWEWLGLDHFDPAQDCTWPQRFFGRTERDAGTVVDAFHCNAIDVDPVSGNLLVSARHLDSVFYVDRTTGRVLWKMGGSTYSKDQARYIAVSDPFYRQHDARLHGWSQSCAGGKGQVSLYDDETEQPGPARAVVYDVFVGGGTAGCDGGGEPADAGEAGSASVAWQRKGTTSAEATGSFRISADGTRVIGWGTTKKERNLVFSEVDVHGDSLLDFYFTDGSTSYRAIPVPATALSLDAMRIAAGSPD